MLVSEIMPEARKVLGRCDEETVLERLSDAVTVLANKAEVDGILGYADICTTSDGCFLTLPREIDTPLAVNVCGRPAVFRNKWYEFHLNGLGTGSMVPWAWDDTGWWPVFMDIINPAELIAVAASQTDLGRILRVFGWDDANQWIRTQEPDGTWRDGFIVPVNVVGDFPGGIIAPAGVREFRRIFSQIPSTEWDSPADHSFATGQAADLTLVAGTLPEPFQQITYYIRRTSARSVNLYLTREDALADRNAIIIASNPTGCTININDSRDVAVETQIQTATPHHMINGSLVRFTAGTMPAPLVSGTTYYVNTLDANGDQDATHFRVYRTQDEALADVNAINCTDAGAAVVAHTTLPCYPITTEVTATNHNLINGDAVTVQNNGGELPAPLQSGVTYYAHVINSNTIALHLTYSAASAGTDPIVLTTAGSGTNLIVKRIAASVVLGTKNNVAAAGHNLSAGDYVLFETTGILPDPLTDGTIYQAQAPSSLSTFTLCYLSYLVAGTSQYQRAASVVTMTTTTAHGYTTGDVVDIEGCTADASFNASQVTITVTGPNTFTYPQALPNAGPFVDAGGTITRGRVNITTAGTGQLYLVISRSFTIGFTSQVSADASALATADPFTFDTDGTLPSCDPTINTATTYYLRVIDGSTIEVFDTPANALDAAVRQTLNRSRAAGIATITTTAAHGLLTGDYVDVRNMTDSTFNTERVQITVTGPTTFTYSNPGAVVGVTADANGQVRRSNIKFLALGAGQLYLAFSRSATVVPRSSLLIPESASYLLENAVVQFTTTGTLPSPLALATDYKIDVQSGRLVVYTLAGTQVVLANIGAGTHSMIIQSDFTAVLNTSVEVVSNNYQTGDGVEVLSDGTPPTPLVAGTTYYIRRIGNDEVELYATAAQALAAPNVAGRIILTTSGDGTHYFRQLLDPFLVKKIERVEKELSDSFIDLYAWDTGRTTALTLIGHYYFDETAPSYRRIKVGKPCAWVRVRYRKRTFKFLSENDFIPISNKMAIIMMLKALEHFRADHKDQGTACEEKAVQWLLEEQLARTGPESRGIQVNNDIYMNTTRQYIT